MSDVATANVVLGTPVVLSTELKIGGVLTDATGAVSCLVVDPLGVEMNHTSGIAHPSVGSYALSVPTTSAGLWHWRWIVDGQATDEGEFTVETAFDETLGAPDLTSLWVLVPRCRRACEGPFGPPTGKPNLTDRQVYEMVADACADMILYSGTLFGHQLIVAERDPLKGYPTEWQTEVLLNEWEGSLLICQAALNYWYFLFRDLKTSEAIANEGSSWEYTLSANVIRDYIASLQATRDLALTGLKQHHPTLARWASNLRVRDIQTAALMEWYDTVSPPGAGPGGLGGGQEAAWIPWTPGWTGPGFTP